MPTSITEPLSSPSPVKETSTIDAVDSEKAAAMNKVKTKSIDRSEKRRKLGRHGKSKESHPEFHRDKSAKVVKSPRGTKATKAYIPNNTSTSFHADTSRKHLPEISRKFMVTHTSDNWKLRKALKNNAGRENKEGSPLTSSSSSSKQKSPQHSKVPEPEERIPSEPPAVKVEESPSSDFLSKLTKRRMSADDVILQRHKRSVENILETLGVREQRLSSIAEGAWDNIPALISHRGSFPNSAQSAQALEEETLSTSGKTSHSSSKRSSYPALEVIDELDSSANEALFFDAFHGQVITHQSQFDEGFGEEEDDEEEFDKKGDDDSNDVDDESSGFHEPGSEGSRKRLPLLSDDFDTDLEESDSEPEEETAGSRNRRRALKTYKTACAKYHLDPNPAFMRQLGKNSIDVRNRMLTFRDAKPIAIALVADASTSFLDISENSLGPEGTAYIAEMMYANRSIIELNMSQTEPGREGLVALVQTLPHNPVLRRLFLDNNSLQQRDGDLIARLISSSQDLRELYINNNTLGFHGIKQIAHALATNKGKLSVLDLQYNNIRTEGAVQIALSLAKNTTLRSLNLAWNGFGIDGCRALASSLGVNKTLRDLDLTCNRLGLRSLEFLVESLKKNRGLSCLRVGHNPMTTEGAKALIVAVTQAKHSGLAEIDLTNIPVDVEFLRLVDKLQETRVVRVIHDSNIHMGTSDMSRAHDGTNLDRFDPVIVLFEYMKKDNLRVIDLFQFFDVKKRDKLSKSDLRAGINILMIPFTEHGIEQIMKTLDTDKDGFISLDEMMKGYREMDRAVKLRRIKASQKNRPDKGLEDLWQILKELIHKRKTENEKRSGGVSTAQPAVGAAGQGDSRAGAGQRVTKTKFMSTTDRKKL